MKITLEDEIECAQTVVVVVIRPTYTERMLTIWEEGERRNPIFMLSLLEATRLRDALTTALKLDRQHVVRSKS